MKITELKNNLAVQIDDFDIKDITPQNAKKINDITIARDRFGEVPLHYSLLETSLFPHFIFCSEIKGLRSLDIDYSTIQMLRPGSYIKVTNPDDMCVKKGVWYDLKQNI